MKEYNGIYIYKVFVHTYISIYICVYACVCVYYIYIYKKILEVLFLVDDLVG